MNPSETDQSSASSGKPKFGAKFLRKDEPVITSTEIPGEETDRTTPTIQKTKTPSTHTDTTSPLSTDAASKFTIVGESTSRPKSPTSKEESYKILTVTESSSISTSRDQKSSVSETRRPVFVTASQQQVLSDVMTDANIILEPHERVSILHEPHERINISHEPRGQIGTSLDTHERVTISHEPHEPVTILHEPHERVTISHEPHERVTISHEPHERVTISHEPHERVTSSHEPHERVRISQGPHGQVSISHEQGSISYEPREQVSMPQNVHEHSLPPTHHKGTILEQAAAVAGGLIKQAALGFNNLAFPKEESSLSAIPRLPPADTTSPIDKFIIQAGASIADGLVSAGELMLGAANAAFPRPQVPRPPRIKFQELVTTNAPHKDDTVYREFTLLPRAPGAQKKENEKEGRIHREEIKNIFSGEDPVQIYTPPEDLRHTAKQANTNVMLPLPPASGVDLTKYSEVSETLNETEQRMRYLRGLARAKPSFFATQPRMVSIPIEAKPSNISSNAEITSRYLEALEMTCKKANEQTAMLIDGNTLQEMSPSNAASHAVYKRKKCLGKQICVMETIQSTDSSGSDQEPSSSRIKNEILCSTTGSSSDASYITSRESKDFLSGRTEFSVTSTKTSNINSSSKISTRQSIFSDYPTAKKKAKGKKEIVCPCSSTSSSESIEKPSSYTIRRSDFQTVKLQSSDKWEAGVGNETDSCFQPKPYLTETDEATAPKPDDFVSRTTPESVNRKLEDDSASKWTHFTSEEILKSKKSASPRPKTRLVSEMPTQTSYISTGPKPKTKHIGETRTQTSLASFEEQFKPFPVEGNAAQTSSGRASPRQKPRPVWKTSTETSNLSTCTPLQTQVSEHPISSFIQNVQSRPKTRFVGQTATQTSFITAMSDQQSCSSVNTSVIDVKTPTEKVSYAYDEPEASHKHDECKEASGSLSNRSHKEKKLCRRSDKAGDVSNMSTVSDIQYLPSLTTPFSESQTRKGSTSTTKKQEPTLLKTEIESKHRTKGQPVPPEKVPQFNVDELYTAANPNVGFHETAERLNVLPVKTKTTAVVTIAKEKKIGQMQTDSSCDVDRKSCTVEQMKYMTKEKKTGQMQTDNTFDFDRSNTLEKLKRMTKEEKSEQMQTDSMLDFDRRSNAIEQLKHVGKMKGGSLASGMDKATLITTTKPPCNKDFRNFTIQKKTKKKDFEINVRDSVEMSPKLERDSYKRSSKRQRRTNEFYESDTIREKVAADKAPNIQDIFECEEAEALKKIQLNWMLTSLLNTATQNTVPTADKKTSVYDQSQQAIAAEHDSLKEAKLKRKLTKMLPITSRNGNTKAFHSRRSSKVPAALASRPAVPFGTEFSNKRHSKQNSKMHKNRAQDEKAFKSKPLWKSATVSSSPHQYWSSEQSHGHATSLSVTAPYKSGGGQVEKPITSKIRHKTDVSELTAPKYSPKICRRLGITLYLAPPLESGYTKESSRTPQEEKTTVLKFYLGGVTNNPDHTAFLNNNVSGTCNTAGSSNQCTAPLVDTARRIVFEVDSKKTTDKLTIIMQSEDAKPHSEVSPEIRAELIEDGKRKKLDEYLDRPPTSFRHLSQPGASLQNIIQAISIQEHPAAALHSMNPMQIAESNTMHSAYNSALQPSLVENLHSEMIAVATQASQALISHAVADAEKNSLVAETMFMQPNTTAGKFVLIMDKQTAEKEEKPNLWKKFMSIPLYKHTSPVLSSVASEQKLVSEFKPPGVAINRYTPYITQPSVIQDIVPNQQEMIEGNTSSLLQKGIENEKCSSRNEILSDLIRPSSVSPSGTQNKLAKEIGSKIRDKQTVKHIIAADSTCPSDTVSRTSDDGQKLTEMANNVSSTFIDSTNVDESFKTYLQQRYAEIFSTDVNNSGTLKIRGTQDSAACNQQQFLASYSPLVEEKSYEESNQTILARIPQLVFSGASTLFQAESFYQQKGPNSGLHDAASIVSEVSANQAFEGCISHSVADNINEIQKNANASSGILQKNFQCKPLHSKLVVDEAHLVLSIPSIALNNNSQTQVPSNQYITTCCNKENESLSSNVSNVSESCDCCKELVVSENAQPTPQVCCTQNECVKNLPTTRPRTLNSGVSASITNDSACTFSEWNHEASGVCNICNIHGVSQAINSEKSFSCSAGTEKQFVQIESNLDNDFSAILLDMEKLPISNVEETCESQHSSALSKRSYSDEPGNAIKLARNTRQGPLVNELNFSHYNNCPATFSGGKTEIPISIINVIPETLPNQTMAAVSELPGGLRKMGANCSVTPHARSAVSNSNDDKFSKPNQQSIIGAEDYRALVASLPRLTRQYKKNLTKLKVDLRADKSENDEKDLALLRHPTTQLASILEAKDLEHEGVDEERCAGITFMPLLPPDSLVHQLRGNLRSPGSDAGMSETMSFPSTTETKTATILTVPESTVPMLLPLNVVSNNNSLDIHQQETNVRQYSSPKFQPSGQPVSLTGDQRVKVDKLSSCLPTTPYTGFHTSESSQTVRRQLEQQTATLLQLFAPVRHILPQDGGENN